MLTPAPKSGKHAALSEGLLASPVRSICSATTSCLRVSENISLLGSSVNSSNPPPLRLQPRIRQNDAFRGWRRAPSGSMLVLVLHKVGAKENAMAEQKSAGGLDFEAMRRAIEQLDADLLTSLYADDAEMLIVNRNTTP